MENITNIKTFPNCLYLYLVLVWEYTVAILGAGYLFWEFIHAHFKNVHIYALVCFVWNFYEDNLLCKYIVKFRNDIIPKLYLGNPR